jgi:hypothetical protein
MKIAVRPKEYKTLPLQFIDRYKSSEKKAWFVKVDGVKRWIPKSLCEIINNDTEIKIESWFVEKMNEAGAMFSDDNTHRYALWRNWNSTKKTALCIGLNPSTANDTTNDPTIERLMHGLIELGYGGFRMVNLFTIISSDPDVLLDEQARNDEELDTGIIFGNALLTEEVIFCWGSFKHAKERSDLLIKNFPDALCFGVNKDGSPWHPQACMYAGLKAEAMRLFKFRDHKYEDNVYGSKTKKAKLARDEAQFNLKLKTPTQK